MILNKQMLKVKDIKNGKIFFIASGLVLIILAGGLLYKYKKEKVNLSDNKATSVAAVSVEQEPQIETQAQAELEVPGVQEQNDVTEVKSVENKTTAAAVKSNVVEKSDPNKRIDCSLDAKRGSYDDRAIISWNCKNYIGWTCDFRVQTINKLYKSVLLPTSSMEVKVMKAGMDMAAYCPKGTKTPSSSCEYRDVKVPGYTSYALFCKAEDGRKKNFDDYYTNDKD
jgi:hypothetical protein